MKNPLGERLMTVKEVQEFLHVSDRTVRKLAEIGALKSVRIGAGRGTIRFKPSDVRAYLESLNPEPVIPVTNKTTRFPRPPLFG